MLSWASRIHRAITLGAGNDLTTQGDKVNVAHVISKKILRSSIHFLVIIRRKESKKRSGSSVIDAYSL